MVLQQVLRINLSPLKLVVRIVIQHIFWIDMCQHGHYGSSKGLLKVLLCNSKYGDRSFPVCAPALWNGLPDHLRLTVDYKYFNADLKAYLFRNCKAP